MTAVLLEDESLRDGLQFEQAVLSLDEKLKIFDMLCSAGVRRVQVGSFVHPKIVPQMADTDEFISQIIDKWDVLITGLVLNDKGLERAMNSGLRHISLSSSASNSHSLKNVKKTSQEALTMVLALIDQATAGGISVRAGIQCAFGCVYEGAIEQETVLDAARQMVKAGAREINLADTTGMANPQQVKTLVGKVQEVLPEAELSLHLHDTRGLGMTNIWAGYEAGVRIFDTSAGGLGGCPFVKGAAGNVPTEDVVNLFESVGIETGIDLEKMCAVSDLYELQLNRDLPGRMSRVLRTTMECSRA